MDKANYQTELNLAQLKAVEHQFGPLIIIAGAGTGKTKTIVARIARLIEKGVEPQAILAITFTNKAANEMATRVRQRLANTSGLDLLAERPMVSTFHALGAYILRQESRHHGLTQYFNILDRDESLALIKQALKESNLDPKQLEPRKLLGRISKEKGNGLNQAAFAAKQIDGERDYFSQIVAEVWAKYEIALGKQKALDFDDLLLKTVELFKAQPEILAAYQNRWSYLMIDEYQDTNVIQYQLARRLTGPAQNIAVVGDLDQSIYSWRGADFRNLLRFETDYPNATVILLTENYRSTKTILTAANEIIRKNIERKEKDLFTNNPTGHLIKLWCGISEKEEAALIAEEVASLIARGVVAEEIAVLYRVNFQSRAIEEAMLHRAIPYQVLGTRFFERREVKEVLAYLKAALNPEDIESAKRITNVPPRGIGKATMAKVHSGQANSLPAKTRDKIKDFQNLLAQIKEQATSVKATPSAVIKFIITNSGIEKMLRDSGTEEDQERLANVQELVTLALRYDNLGPGGIEQLLTDAALATDQDELDQKKKSSGIKLMTVHAAKGLEFRHVFVAGLEQDLFPHSGFGETDRDSEEERRLFYVAITRARESLYLTYAESRTIFGSRQITLPSEFLSDIPNNLIEQKNYLLSIEF